MTKWKYINKILTCYYINTISAYVFSIKAFRALILAGKQCTQAYFGEQHWICIAKSAIYCYIYIYLNEKRIINPGEFTPTIKLQITPPFKPQVTSETDTRYFDREFTGESVQLTPPDQGEHLNSIDEESEYFVSI